MLCSSARIPETPLCKSIIIACLGTAIRVSEVVAIQNLRRVESGRAGSAYGGRRNPSWEIWDVGDCHKEPRHWGCCLKYSVIPLTLTQPQSSVQWTLFPSCYCLSGAARVWLTVFSLWEFQWLSLGLTEQTPVNNDTACVFPRAFSLLSWALSENDAFSLKDFYFHQTLDSPFG